MKTKVFVLSFYITAGQHSWQAKNTVSQKKSEVNILCSEQIKGKHCFDSNRKDSLGISEKWQSN